MDLYGMRERVRRQLRDDAETFQTNEMIRDWLNDAQLDLATRLGSLHTEQASTLNNANGTIPLPSDFVSLDRLNISYDYGPNDVEWTDDEEFQSYKEDGVATPGQRLGRIYASNIELYPAPANGTAYALRYTRTPVPLVNDTDTPEVEAELHLKLVYFAVAQGKLMDGEPAQANEWLAFYNDGLPSPRTGRSRFMPGPLKVMVEGGPFDVSEAAHI